MTWGWHLSLSLNGADQIYMSKFDATKFGDHPSIISVGNDVQRFFPLFLLMWPLKGANQIIMSKLDKKVPKNATDKVW
jgi:hypothetical protein